VSGAPVGLAPGLGADVLMPNYGPRPVSFVRGEGCFLFDEEGRRYLDFLSGIAVCALGHAHPKVAAAVAAQAAQLVHVSNFFGNPVGLEAARRIDRLVSRACGGPAEGGLGQVFFANSGAEANEAAIKLARRYGGSRREIVAALGGFHGRTLGALAATGQPAKQEPFRPLPEGFRHVPYGDVEALAAAVDERTAAVFLEAVQGEAGVIVPPDGYLIAARRICDRAGALLMVDEVQCGLGRTGRWFGFEHDGVVPDVVTLAKALGNGVPIGACWARREVAAAFRPGDHGSTFGGQPLAAAAALATLQEIEGCRLPERAAEAGARLMVGLRQLPGVVGVRGRGLLVGALLAPDVAAAEIARRCLAHGLVVNAIGADVLRLAPPLVVADDEIDLGLELLGAAIANRPPAPPGLAPTPSSPTSSLSTSPPPVGSPVAGSPLAGSPLAGSPVADRGATGEVEGTAPADGLEPPVRPRRVVGGPRLGPARHLLDVDDLSRAELAWLVASADLTPPRILDGRGVALVFEHPSARTRHSAEMAVADLGGRAVMVQAAEVGIDRRESAEDVARTLACFHAAVGARVADHTTLERMARAIDAEGWDVPVVNLLSDQAHPLQALADLTTLARHFGGGRATASALAARRIAWVGDATNVCRSLALGVALVGGTMVVASPEGYGLPEGVLRRCAEAGGGIRQVIDPADAVEGADAVLTDVWVSMGQEAEAPARRLALREYRVDRRLMARAAVDAVFLHCLPAHRGDEVTAEVVESARSLVWQEVADRRASLRTLLALLCRDRRTPTGPSEAGGA